MEFIKGNKIQAVDENGHWCSGIVENVLDGKEQYEIGFKGWSKEFNRIVSTKEIRPSILPAEEQIRVDGVLPGRRQDRKSASSAQKQQLKLLRKGDQITVEKMGIAEVSQIDIFTMKAYVIEPQEGKGKWVNASDIILKALSPMKVTKNKRRRMNNPTKICDSSSSSMSDLMVINPKSGLVPASSEDHVTDGIIGNQEAPVHQSSTFKIGHVTCGKLYKISGCPVTVSVKDLDIFNKTATCLYFDQMLDKDVVISVPVSRLEGPQSCRISKPDSRFLANITNQAMVNSISNMSSGDYRRELRKEQLKTLINHEIKGLLVSRSCQRRFTIGPATIDVDLDVFNLSPLKTESSYGYRKSRHPLSFLDKLLGDKWDITESDQGVRFITCVKLKISKDYTLTATISAALCRGLTNIPKDYRMSLEADINTAGALEEDNAEVLDE